MEEERENTRIPAKEKSALFNSLSILLKALEKKKTTIDLRNESSIYGLIDQTDAFMNVIMKDCVFTDPRGDKFPYETFFIHSRNIRLVHIPPNIPIIPAIKNQLDLLKNPQKNHSKLQKGSFRKKRIEQKQQADAAAVDKLLQLQRESKDK